MTTYNFCKRLNVATKILLEKYAKRLDASEMIIHKNGSISLYCNNDCICENYTPTAKELYKNNNKELNCNELLQYDLIIDWNI